MLSDPHKPRHGRLSAPTFAAEITAVIPTVAPPPSFAAYLPSTATPPRFPSPPPPASFDTDSTVLLDRMSADTFFSGSAFTDLPLLGGELAFADAPTEWRLESNADGGRWESGGDLWNSTEEPLLLPGATRAEPDRAEPLPSARHHGATALNVLAASIIVGTIAFVVSWLLFRSGPDNPPSPATAHAAPVTLQVNYPSHTPSPTHWRP